MGGSVRAGTRGAGHGCYSKTVSGRMGVPEGALGRMLERWEVPDSTEAHAVEWVVRD